MHLWRVKFARTWQLSSWLFRHIRSSRKFGWGERGANTFECRRKWSRLEKPWSKRVRISKVSGFSRFQFLIVEVYIECVLLILTEWWLDAIAILLSYQIWAMHFSFAMGVQGEDGQCMFLIEDWAWQQCIQTCVVLRVTCWRVSTICARKEVQNVSKSRMMNRSLWRHLGRETVAYCFHIFPPFLELHFHVTSSMALGHWAFWTLICFCTSI